MISLILLAGGKGIRLGSALPKQFLPLGGIPIALHSLDIFLHSPWIGECIVVCAAEHRHYFEDRPLLFAEPGERRQDSLYHGLQKASGSWICVHDAARPFIDTPLLERLYLAGMEVGAAAVGMPIKATVKEASEGGLVARTLDRSLLWEIQTPQIVSRAILEQGFAIALEQNLTVTDDVSLAELAGHRVKLVKGSDQNFKITTPHDLTLAKSLL